MSANPAVSAGDEAQLRDMIDQWRDAVRRKDIDALLQHYSPRLVSFDAWGALSNPLSVYREHWEACFNGHDGPLEFGHHDLQLTVGERVAFCHCIIELGGTMVDGTKHRFRGRGTICFEKVDGRWQVTHEHASAPFDPMTGQVKGDLDA